MWLFQLGGGVVTAYIINRDLLLSRDGEIVCLGSRGKGQMPSKLCCDTVGFKAKWYPVRRFKENVIILKGMPLY